MSRFKLAVLGIASLAVALTAQVLAHSAQALSFVSGDYPAASVDNGQLVYWSAVSTTAMAITGDVALGTDRLVIGDEERSYHLTKVRKLDEAETEITARLLGEQHLRGATLYNIDIPGSEKFRSGNRLCGRNDVSKVIVAEGAREEASLDLIFFEGSREPYFKGWEHTVGGLCGTFGYMR